MKGMRNCMLAMVEESKKNAEDMDQFQDDIKAEMKDKETAQHITVEGDYFAAPLGKPCALPETMNGAPRFLYTPVEEPTGHGNMMWIASDYHYYMNCADEVEKRVWDDFLTYNETNSANVPEINIPPFDYYRLDPRPGHYEINEMPNEGFQESILEDAKSDDGPWPWQNVGLFYQENGAHVQETLSWASDEVKDFYKLRLSWLKEEMQEVRFMLDPWMHNYKHRFCSALPTFKRIYGTPIRQDGCNPKYPYTSWTDEGFDSKAEDCDAHFHHETPYGFSEDKIIRGPDGGTVDCFWCGNGVFGE